MTDEDYENAAELLSDMLDRPVEEFTAEGYEYPDFDDLELVEKGDDDG